jgi:hypothetical protein
VTDKPDIKSLILGLMKQQTERDKQIKVGASNFSTLCSRCVAQDLLATHGSGSSPYWLGAWMGTAMHNRLDAEAQVHRPAWVPEQKLVMGHLEGYGTIKSTTDLYVPDIFTVVDYKSTTKAKIKYIKDALQDPESIYEATAIKEARFKVGGYRNQGQSYGRGLVQAGHRVDWVSLCFVCRDGTGDGDVWAWTEPYNQERAEAVWNRVERLWAWLQEGHKPEELSPSQFCYACQHRGDLAC